MALLTTQSPTPSAGLVPAFASVAASDTFVPTDRTFIYLKNTNAATRTITVTTPGTSGGFGVADYGPITIAATTGELLLGPFPANYFADPTTGLATVTASATAGVSIAVVTLSVTP